jgi:hypothetical protein
MSYGLIGRGRFGWSIHRITSVEHEGDEVDPIEWIYVFGVEGLSLEPREGTGYPG